MKHSELNRVSYSPNYKTAKSWKGEQLPLTLSVYVDFHIYMELITKRYHRNTYPLPFITTELTVSRPQVCPFLRHV